MRAVFIIFFVLLIFQAALRAEKLEVILETKVTYKKESVDKHSFQSEVQKYLSGNDISVKNVNPVQNLREIALTQHKGKLNSGVGLSKVDATVIYNLHCDDEDSSFLGTEMRSYSCDLSVIVTDPGTENEILNETKNFILLGPDLKFALRVLFEEDFPKIMPNQIKRWKGNISGKSEWTISFLVANVQNVKDTVKLAETLTAKKFVESCRMVQFSRELTEFKIQGKGKSHFEGLRNYLYDSDLNIDVTYQSGKLFYGQYDTYEAVRKNLFVFVDLKASKKYSPEFKESGRDIIASYLSNLHYFKVTDISEKRGRGRALNLKVKLSKLKNYWLSTLKLINRKELLITISKRGKNPFDSLASVFQEFDKKYKSSLTKASFRKKVGLGKKVELTDVIKVDKISVNNIFPSLTQYYKKHGIGSIEITPEDDLENIEATYKLGDIVIGSSKVDCLEKGKSFNLVIKPNIIPDLSKTDVQLEVSLSFKAGNLYRKKTIYAPLITYKSNFLDWNSPETVASFISSHSNNLKAIVAKSLSAVEERNLLTTELTSAAYIYSGIWHKLKYIKDPVMTNYKNSIDSVQFPLETLKNLSGDCDDLTVLMASLFESAGIATAVIVLPNHVLLAIESGVLVGGELLFDLPKEAFVEIDGALFVPIETTTVNDSFAKAWIKGADILKSQKDKKIFRTREAWKTYGSYVAEEKELKFELSLKKPVNTLETIRININGQRFATADKLHTIVMEDKNQFGTLDKKNFSPVAKALLDWFNGDKESAINQSLNLCEKGVIAACYNSAIMLSSSGEQLEALLSELPSNVISMMIDNQRGTEASIKIRLKGRGKIIKKLNDIALKRDGKLKIATKRKPGKKKVVLSGRKNLEFANSISPFSFFWSDMNE